MGWGDSSFLWIFALLILANGGFGGFGFGNGFNNAIGYENLATNADVQRGFDNQNLQAQTRDILSAVNSGTAQTIAASNSNAVNAINAIKDGNASVIREFGIVENGLTSLAATAQECCCANLRASDEVKYQGALNTAGINANIAQNKYEAALNTAGINSNIAQNRYESALNTAAINENMTAQTQKILDAITGNRIADMQNQINQLELQNQLASVVRYPNNTFYAVPSPCFNTGCGCGCGNI